MMTDSDMHNRTIFHLYIEHLNRFLSNFIDNTKHKVLATTYFVFFPILLLTVSRTIFSYVTAPTCEKTRFLSAHDTFLSLRYASCDCKQVKFTRTYFTADDFVWYWSEHLYDWFIDKFHTVRARHIVAKYIECTNFHSKNYISNSIAYRIDRYQCLTVNRGRYYTTKTNTKLIHNHNKLVIILIFFKSRPFYHVVHQLLKHLHSEIDMEYHVTSFLFR